LASSPFLAITLDLKRRIGRTARALGMDVGTMAWGVLELLEHVWERKDPAVSALVVAACFGPDPRVAPALVEFGLLVATDSGWNLCEEETDRLLLTHRQRVAAGKARAEGAGRSGGAFTSGPPADHQREASGPPAGNQLLHPAPSTQHPPKEPPPPAPPRGANVVPLRTSERSEEEEVDRLWEFMQSEREKLGRSREKRPKAFSLWAAGVLREVGSFRLTAAYSRYLLDDDFSLRGWPMPVFQTPGVWRPRANEVRDTS
jgi:hypothetical protein